MGTTLTTHVPASAETRRDPHAATAGERDVDDVRSLLEELRLQRQQRASD